METVAQPPPDAELHLLTEWREPGSGERTRRAAIGSVLTHVAIIGILMSLPAYVPPPPEQSHRIVTPLIEPMTELTQKAPNTAKITKEFNAPTSPAAAHPVTAGSAVYHPAGGAAPAPVIPPMPAQKAAQPARLCRSRPNSRRRRRRLPKSTCRRPRPAAPAADPSRREPKSIFENVAPAATGVARPEPGAHSGVAGRRRDSPGGAEQYSGRPHCGRPGDGHRRDRRRSEFAALARRARQQHPTARATPWAWISSRT